MDMLLYAFAGILLLIWFDAWLEERAQKAEAAKIFLYPKPAQISHLSRTGKSFAYRTQAEAEAAHLIAKAQASSLIKRQIYGDRPTPYWVRQSELDRLWWTEVPLAACEGRFL